VTQVAHALSEGWQAFLLLAFGVSTSLVILALGGAGARPLDLLLLAASLGALLTAGIWLWILAARRSFGWGLLFLNFVVASVYARRYWAEGARKPALLALAAIFAQTIASLRVFLVSVTPPI
jgi:hypothetical protein